MSLNVKKVLSNKDEEVLNLRKQLKAVERHHQNYQEEYGALIGFFREVKDHIALISPKPQEYKQPGKAHVHSPCVAVMQICDIHLGSIQPAYEVERINAYSPDIAKKRCFEYCRRLIEWVTLHRHSYTINELVILVVGDMISGDIHEELRVTNEYPAPIQSVEAGVLLGDMIAYVAPYFQMVRVEFIVEDNHGRLSKKPQAKEAGLNSFNYVVGFIAKERTKQLKNLKFNIYPQYEAVVQVSTRRYLCTHGHGVMGWSGFPYYGIERKVSKEALVRMNGPDMSKFHRVIMGHFHAPLSHQWYWIGGSVQGTDAFDHKQGRHAPPSQPSWMVHPKWGEFDRTDFWL